MTDPSTSLRQAAASWVPHHMSGHEAALVELLLMGALGPSRELTPALGFRVEGEVGQMVALRDTQGVTVAGVEVTEQTQTGTAGRLVPVSQVTHYDFHEHRLTPRDLQEWAAPPVVGLAWQGVLEPAARDAAAEATQAQGGRLLLMHLTPHGGAATAGHGAVAELNSLEAALGQDRVRLVLLPDPGELLPVVAESYGVTDLRRAHSAPSHVTPAGMTLFFTGLSGSGKSTIAHSVAARLTAAGRTVTVLDGDEVRLHLSSELTFSAEHRDLNIRRIGWVAAEVTKHGGVAVCAPIAPYDATRKAVREMVERYGRFVLVHVATPLEVCEQRDRKGLYALARAGKIPAFTGISDPYEAPQDAELVIDTSTGTIDEAVESVLQHLRETQPHG